MLHLVQFTLETQTLDFGTHEQNNNRLLGQGSGWGGGGRCMTNISRDHGTINIGKSDTPGLNNNNNLLVMTG